MTGAIRRMPAVMMGTAANGTRLLERLPTIIDTTRVGGLAATNALQSLPDSTLRWLAAGSVGLGAGLYLTGAPQLVVAASVAPALAMAAAVVLRPIEAPALENRHR